MRRADGRMEVFLPARKEWRQQLLNESDDRASGVEANVPVHHREEKSTAGVAQYK